MLTKLNAHNVFIEQLPANVSTNTIILKIAAIAIVGFFLSIISVVFAAITANYNLNSQDNGKFFLVVAAQNLPIAGLTIIFFYRHEIGKLYKMLFLSKANKSIVLILGFLLIELLIGLVLNTFSFNIQQSPERTEWLRKYILSGPNAVSLDYLKLLTQSSLVFLFIAFVEEFIFRFTIYRFLRSKGFICALVISSILFGIIHGTNGFISTFIFGILVAIYYEYTNFFLGTVIIHALNNLLIVYCTYFLTYLLLQAKL